MKDRTRTNRRAAGAALIGVIALLSACASGPATTELNGVKVSTLDRGARWLSQGIDEVSALGVVSAEQQEAIVGYLANLMIDASLRGDAERHEEFLSGLESDGCPEDAVQAAEAAIVRASSPLNYHEGYWVTITESPEIPRPIEALSDVHVDAWTGREL